MVFIKYKIIVICIWAEEAENDGLKKKISNYKYLRRMAFALKIFQIGIFRIYKHNVIFQINKEKSAKFAVVERNLNFSINYIKALY